METLLARIAAVYGNTDIDIKKKCVLVFCADNGVVSEGVAQSGADVTTAIARMMAANKSASALWPAPAAPRCFRWT
jgi:nicotinate-nucleotide--dimethylbenzimidazole phosphoribosyltransferase